MAEHLAGELQVAGGAVGEAGGQVPEVVQADRRQTRLDDHAVEPLGGAVRHQGGPVGLGEHQAGVDPCGAQLQPQLGLPPAVGAQHLDGAGVQADGASAGVGLGVALDDVPGDLHAGLTDRDRATVEVDVGPGQTEGLGAAQTAEGDEVPQGVELVASGVVEEGTGLLRGPHHGRGRTLAGALPLLDAVLGPHERPV
nr:hypothetical protein [Blastococcus sp. TBT05-19]